MKKIYKLQSLLLLTAAMLVSSVMYAQISSTASGGNWSATSTWVGGVVPTSGTVIIVGNATVTVDISTATCATLQINPNDNTVTGTLAFTNGSLLNVTTNLTIGGAGNRRGAINMTNSGTLKLGGTITVNNLISYIPGSGTVEYSAVGAQTVSASFSPYNNLTVSGSGTKTVTGVTVNGTLTMKGAAALGSSPTFGASSTLEYAGTAAQLTSNNEWPASGAAPNVKINNSNGVILHAARSVTGSVTFTDGILSTTSANLLTIGTAGSVSGASNTSFVDGPIAKTGNTAFTFPVGKTGTGYQPIGVAAISASTTFTAEYFRASGAAKGAANAPLQVVSVCEHWGLFASSAVGVDVTLYWNANSGCSSGDYIRNLSVLRIARYNGASGSTWSNASNFNSQDPASNSTSGNMTATLASGAFTNPTFFTFGSTDAGQSPLPVMYANVKAYTKTGGVQIEWSNLTERDLTGYDVQRSVDGVSFTSFSHQQPKNNLNDKADYTDFDAAPANGTNYYRIKAYEINGKIIYSKILRVETGSTVKQQISMYPNPVTGNQVTIGLNNVKSGQYTLRIVNTAGQDVLTKTITNQGTSTSETIQLPSSIKPGVYTMLISGDDFRENKMFVVQ